MSDHEPEVTKLLTEALADAAPSIDARVALTGRPRVDYETWLTRPPRPGQTWEDALYGRLLSLEAGPPLPQDAERLRRQMRASLSRSADAA